MSMNTPVDKYLETCMTMDTSERKYLEMGVLGPIAWTRQLQDLPHREEQETSMSLGIWIRESQMLKSCRLEYYDQRSRFEIRIE